MIDREPHIIRLPEAGESVMLPPISTDGILMHEGVELSFPPDQLGIIVDRLLGGEQDKGFEAVETLAGNISLQLTRSKVEDVLSAFNDQERRAIEMRFGLVDGKHHSFREVAEDMGVSESTARRREKSALSKLRNPSRSEKFRDYFQE